MDDLVGATFTLASDPRSGGWNEYTGLKVIDGALLARNRGAHEHAAKHGLPFSPSLISQRDLAKGYTVIAREEAQVVR